MSFVGSYVTATYADFKALTIILLIELSQIISWSKCWSYVYDVL